MLQLAPSPLRISFLRVLVTRRRYGYAPGQRERAPLPVLEQAELLGKDWVG